MGDKRSKSNIIFSGIAWTVIQNAVKILYGLLAVPFLINFYGKEEYGLIGLALSVNAYVALLDMGMTNSNVRFFSEYIAKGDKERLQKLFNLTHLFYLCIGIFNTIILVGLSFFVDRFFKVTPDQAVTLRNLIYILALNATFSWISICYDQFLRANDLIDWIKKRSTFLRLLLFVVLAIAIIFKWPIEWYFFGFTFMATIILPLTLIKARRVMPTLHCGFRFDRNMFKTIYPYALGIFSFGIFHFFASSSRTLFLGNLVGPGAVAEFTILSTMTSVVILFTSSLTQVLLPVLTKMKVTDDVEGVNSIIIRGTKYVSSFLSMLVFIIAISAKELLSLYVGNEYVNLWPWLVLWLLTLLLSHRNVMTALVFTEKRLTTVAAMGATAMSAGLLIYALLTPVFGVGGVVIGWTVHELIHTLFYYVYFLPNRFKINTKKVFVRSVMPSWLIFGGVSLIVFFITELIGLATLWLVIVRTIMAGLVFIALLWRTILNKEDKMFVFSFVEKNRTHQDR